MTRIVGLDLSLKKSGLALPDGTFATVTPRSSTTGYRRNTEVVERVYNLIEDASPDLVVIEDYNMRPKGQQALIAAAEVGGPVRAALARDRVPFALVRPSSLKMFAVGKGNAKKAELFDAARRAIYASRERGVNERIDTEPANYDEADAYWLARMAHAHYGELIADDLADKRIEALAKVDWPEL